MSAQHAQIRATDSFGRPLPADAISITVLMPPSHRAVILYVSDDSVAIHGKPVVGWNSDSIGTPRWWTGVPGHYIDLQHERWVVTHWAAMPGDHDSIAAIARATGATS